MQIRNVLSDGVVKYGHLNVAKWLVELSMQKNFHPLIFMLTVIMLFDGVVYMVI